MPNTEASHQHKELKVEPFGCQRATGRCPWFLEASWQAGQLHSLNWPSQCSVHSLYCAGQEASRAPMPGHVYRPGGGGFQTPAQGPGPDRLAPSPLPPRAPRLVPLCTNPAPTAAPSGAVSTAAIDQQLANISLYSSAAVFGGQTPGAAASNIEECNQVVQANN